MQSMECGGDCNLECYRCSGKRRYHSSHLNIIVSNTELAICSHLSGEFWKSMDNTGRPSQEYLLLHASTHFQFQTSYFPVGTS